MLSHARRLVSLLATCVAAALFINQAAGSTAQPLDPTGICRIKTLEAEKRHKIPARLLIALSLAESGRWMKERREKVAWPWTVYAEGRGRYLPSKEAAIREVRALKAKGVRNIDVGCMQVNLHHHGTAFPDLETAFDPASNVAYAAALLRQHHLQTRSWNLAVGRYHSSTPRYNLPYRKRVLALWDLERRRWADERKEANRRLYEQRRALLIARKAARKSAWLLKTVGLERGGFESNEGGKDGKAG